MATAKKEKIEYTKPQLILGNLAIVVWVLFGTATVWLFNPFAALGFFALSGFLISMNWEKKAAYPVFSAKPALSA